MIRYPDCHTRLATVEVFGQIHGGLGWFSSPISDFRAGTTTSPAIGSDSRAGTTSPAIAKILEAIIAVVVYSLCKYPLLIFVKLFHEHEICRCAFFAFSIYIGNHFLLVVFMYWLGWLELTMFSDM